MLPNARLMLAGATAILIGILIRWRASRYDLEDAAIDSAWTLLRGKRTAENPTAIEAKLQAARCPIAADVGAEGQDR